MPPDRLKTTNPQGRQKACSECAKGKRKCSLEYPSCARCSKQRLSCTYPPQPTARSPAAEDAVIDGSGDLELPDMSMGLEDIANNTLSLDFDLQPLPQACTNLADFDLSAGITSLDALSQMLHDSPDSEEQMAVGRASHHTRDAFSPANIAPYAKSRVEWSIQQLKLAPRMMVEKNGTPWQHAMLYEEYMPRYLQDAYAACALYNARNGTNDEMVAKFIREHVRELATAPVPQQPTELLARAHTLILYQIMLVFGGDIRLYSQANLLLPLMDEVGTALLPLSAQEIDPIGPLPFYPSTAARAAWSSYVFRESLRRTILSLFHFATMCRLLQGQSLPCSSHLILGNRVTLSAHLWNAKSAFEYAVAWNNENHFLVQELNFTEVMRVGNPEDVDVFGKMMMIGLHGEDDIRGWLYTKGGTL